MNPSAHSRQQPQAEGGFKMHDILYVLFKHKWKIILLSIIGFTVAGILGFKIWISPSYESQAKLLIRYVVERNATDPEAPDGLQTGISVMRTELEILSSTDLALAVAKIVGPDKILPKGKGPVSPSDIAQRVVNGFKVESVDNSNVLLLSYRDSDPKLAVSILDAIIQTYKTKHLEIHRSPSAYDEIITQADQARSVLRTTEEEINRLKSQSGVLNIDSTVKDFESRRKIIGENLLDAQAAFAAQKAKVITLEKNPLSRQRQEAAADTTAVQTPKQDDPLSAADQRKLAQASADYNDGAERLQLLKKERNLLLLRRPSSDPSVSTLDQQIEAVQRTCIEIIQRFPEVAANIRPLTSSNGLGGPTAILSPVTSLADERALRDALDARIAEINLQAKSIESQVENLSALGFRLANLERRRQIEDDKYRYLQGSLEKARADESLDANKIPNISTVQQPCAPIRSIDSKTMKTILGIAASGIFAGLGLAFLFEKVLDRRVSRPVDIQARLQLPLMLSIPFLKGRERVLKLQNRGDEMPLIGENRRKLTTLLPSDPSSIAPPGRSRVEKPKINNDPIAPFAAAIHDRILFHFQVNNINHTPKLVGFTGLTAGAGATTIARSVAETFSEDSNRKVLLVDLNPSTQGGDEQSHPGDSLFRAIEISKDKEFRAAPTSLYYASAPTRRNQVDSLALAPTGLREILPHLVSSDFDYIIFDMPPVAPTSPTLVMAGFMDKVLLVLDADRTTPDHLNWAYAELEKGRADVSCIFNKARSHAPRWVEGDL